MCVLGMVSLVDLLCEQPQLFTPSWLHAFHVWLCSCSHLEVKSFHVFGFKSSHVICFCKCEASRETSCLFLLVLLLLFDSLKDKPGLPCWKNGRHVAPSQVSAVTQTESILVQQSSIAILQLITDMNELSYDHRVCPADSQVHEHLLSILRQCVL